MSLKLNLKISIMIILQNIQKIKVYIFYQLVFLNMQYNFLMKISKEIFSVCNCKGIARIDYIMSNKNKKIYFLEMNTHPGLTKISLAPEQANYQGLLLFIFIKTNY